jgi:molybdenum-dependent DNA-binding transcriptional regulator ModE
VEPPGSSPSSQLRIKIFLRFDWMNIPDRCQQTVMPNRATHFSVANSTDAVVFQGPRRWITSAMYKSLMIPANALSQQFPDAHWNLKPMIGMNPQESVHNEDFTYQPAIMNLHRLDIVSLSLFSQVARAGSISKGAGLTHLAVGAASKRISDLEQAVGAVLLEPHSRGVTLTLTGEALYRHAQRILSDIDLLADVHALANVLHT